MTVKSLKCLTCGGDLMFNPTLQKWKCEWCDSEFAETDLKPDDFDNIDSSDSGVIETAESMENPDIKVYRCSYCGAEVVTDNVTAATFCVYCQRPIVLGSQLSGSFKPAFVVPFKNTKDQALNTFKEYLKGKRFLPNEYKNEQNIEKLTGVYIPFWLYEGDVSFKVRGEADIVSTRRSGDYNITKTDIYSIAREGQIKIDNMPVDASSRTPDDIMDSIEPFDFTTLTDFSTNYLSGFLAEKYDEKEEALYERAKTRFEGSAENKINRSLSKYSAVRKKTNMKRVDNVKSKYGLLPVWILYSMFRNKQYIYAMNGQTGKITGDLPVDGGKIFIFWFITSLILGAVCGVIGALLEYLVLGIILGVVIGSIVTMMEVKRHKPVEKARHADYYIKDGDAVMSVVEDKYLRSTETKTKVSSSDIGNSKK